ncbi:hypothetical protein [Vibrio vulnificus YJ016]|uniref:Uncharacterized protein n=1 Tax=Vibrio vulnificus (strain YJ016) TaxID=196600 RepID=Q7MBS5_VIBVY|nr:hypothetical protein [Vibrio vulnificus YJ016]
MNGAELQNLPNVRGDVTDHLPGALITQLHQNDKQQIGDDVLRAT